MGREKLVSQWQPASMPNFGSRLLLPHPDAANFLKSLAHRNEQILDSLPPTMHPRDNQVNFPLLDKADGTRNDGTKFKEMNPKVVRVLSQYPDERLRCQSCTSLDTQRPSTLPSVIFLNKMIYFSYTKGWFLEDFFFLCL